MTTNDKLRRLREWVVAHQHNDDWGVPVSYGVIDEIDRLLAEPEAQAPSEAASPVTDAEVEAAIESVRVAAHRYGVDAWAPTLIDESQALKSQEDKAVCDLRALIARRVQQAGAAAEELARALEAVRKRLDLPGHAECPHPKECPWAEDHEVVGEIDSALAAFRAAQGGGSNG